MRFLKDLKGKIFQGSEVQDFSPEMALGSGQAKGQADLSYHAAIPVDHNYDGQDAKLPCLH